MFYGVLLIFSINSFLSNCANITITTEKSFCDNNCWFDEEEINSTTIKKWPINCSTVCGELRFTQNSDIPIFDLQTEYFKNLRIVRGGMTFYHSLYSNLDFFSSLEEFYCSELNGLTFAFNSALETLNFDNLKSIDCNAVYAYENAVLDSTEFCEKFQESITLFIYDNYKNCKSCVSGQIYTTDLNIYKNCTSIINGLNFQSIVPSNDPLYDIGSFKNIQNVTGNLIFFKSEFQNFSFLENLENLKSNSYWYFDIDIYHCFNLTRFAMPSLKTISTSRDRFIINVDGVHDDFCLTSSEFKFFMENNVYFEKLDGKFCEIDTTACIFVNLQSLAENCVEILGKVRISSGDEEYVDKLNNVNSIFGSLIVRGTNLTDLNFLGSLEYVAIMNDTTISFQIVSNEQLQSAELPSLKRVFSMGKYQITFVNNSQGLLNSTTCWDLTENLFNTRISFDGRECETIDRNITDNSAFWYSNSWSLSIGVLLALV